MGDIGRLSAGDADLSPASTTVAFDRIIPPMRVPMPAGVDDDPSKGRWVLGFAEDASWRRSLEMCHTNVFKQCEMGARMGCSIRAAKSCRIPWWKQVLLYLKLEKLEEGAREACEEREMNACLTDAKEACTRYARDMCSPVYADARIAAGHVALDPRFRPRSKGHAARKILDSQLTGGSGNEDGVEGSEWSEESEDRRPTNYRGREHMTEQSGSSWGGPSWNESSIERNVTSRAAEVPVDGWEGGLIRPKIGRRTTEPSVKERN